MKFYILLIAAYAVLAVVALHPFLIADATTVIGLMVLPMTFLLNRTAHVTHRWGMGVLIFGIFSAFLPSYTFFFLSIVAAVLWLWESQIGRLSGLPFLVFLTISPLFRYFTDVFSFDLRLTLTCIAAKIMAQIDPSVSALGNVIRLSDGSDWQIDEACMGLNMLALSLILTYFFIAFLCRKHGQMPNNRLIFTAVFATLLLNCLANLTRIVAIVFLKIYPQTIAHDVVGLVTLSVYVLLPMYFFIKIWVKKYSQLIDNQVISKNIPPQYFQKGSHGACSVKHETANALYGASSVATFLKPTKQAVHLLVFSLLALRGVDLFYQKQNDVDFTQKPMEKAGFTSKMLKNGVCQLQNDSALVYIKSIPNFFSTEHSPMICWRGSGYAFKRIERRRLGATEIYTGILEKDTHQIHAAWWFSDGRGVNTIDQTTWRWAAFTEGSVFNLVNVNAESEQQVLDLANAFLGSSHTENTEATEVF